MKLSKGKEQKTVIKININMRCIEILFGEYGALAGREININMRCIEMLNDDFKRRYVKRLTLT